MFRSFTNRIFGGVCSGLGAVTPLSPAVWRLIWIILAALTAGAAVLAYLLLWWVLPQQSLVERRRGSALRTLLGLAGAVALVGGYFAREALHEAAGADIYWPAALLFLALVFLLLQLMAPRGVRTNFWWGLVAVLVTLVPLLGALGIIPPGIYDLLVRAAPAVLVFAGLSILLRDRVPLGNLVALVLALAIPAGIAVTAFSVRSNQPRTDRSLVITEAVSEAVTTLQVDVTTLDTDIEFFAAPAGGRTIQAEFTGSEASTIEQRYVETDNGIATLELVETRADPFPRLEQIGRGRLLVELPQGIATAVTFSGQRGAGRFDLVDVDLERLSFDLRQGDALVTLPDYQPLSPSVSANPGLMRVRDGSLRVIVPPDVGVRFVLERDRGRRPVFDDTLYNLIDDGADGTLESDLYQLLDVQLAYRVVVPNGEIRVDTAGE